MIQLFNSDDDFSLGGWISVAITLYTNLLCLPLIAMFVTINSIINTATILQLKAIIENMHNTEYIIPIHRVETHKSRHKR